MSNNRNRGYNRGYYRNNNANTNTNNTNTNNTNNTNTNNSGINNRYVSSDQRYLLDFYMNLYNQTSRQIDLLYSSLDEIRHNIDNISGVNEIISNNSPVRTPISIPAPVPAPIPAPPVPIPAPAQLPQTTSGRRRRNRSSHYNFGSNQDTDNAYNYRYLVYNIPSRAATTQTSTSDYNSIFGLLRNFYDRVPVAPTQEILNTATRVCQFSDILNPLNSSCPITLDRFENNSSVTLLLGCNHIFTPTSINLWFRSNVLCPVCRHDIRTPITNNVAPPNNDNTNDVDSNEDYNNDDYNHDYGYEESKEEEQEEQEEELEETKEDPSQPINNNHSNSSTSFNERNSNRNNIDDSYNALRDVAQSMLTQLLTSGTNDNIFYDASSNPQLLSRFSSRF
jgi:Ring finger domain